MSGVSHYASDPRCYLLIAQNFYMVFISFAAIYINSYCRLYWERRILVIHKTKFYIINSLSFCYAALGRKD